MSHTHARIGPGARRWLPLVCGFVAVIVLAGPVDDACATSPRIDQGVYFIGLSSALPQNSLAIQRNPAGLARQETFEAQVHIAGFGSDNLAARGAGWSAVIGMPFGPFGLGLAVEHVRDPAPGAPVGPAIVEVSRISAGGGFTVDDWLHAGAAVRAHTAQAGPVGTIVTTDIGLLVTPWRWVSIGGRVSDLIGASSFVLPDTIPAITGPQYAWGAALHLFDDTIRWAGEIGWPNASAITHFTSTVSIAVARDYRISAEFQQTLHHENVTGHARGNDTRFGVVLRWNGPTAFGAGGLWRDFPTAAEAKMGVTATAGIRLPIRPSVWERTKKLAGVVKKTLEELPKKKAVRAKTPTKALTEAEVRDHTQRRKLGWKPALKGKYRKEAVKVARSVMAFSAAMANENKTGICQQFAAGSLRFDIETHDPAMTMHKTLTRKAACASLHGGGVGKYAHEFGPSHPHADVSSLLPELFNLHGSPFLHLPAVQLQTYAKLVHTKRKRGDKLTCNSYRAAMLPRMPDTPPKQRRYDVEIRCEGVSTYNLQVQGNRKLGFLVRKFSMRR